MPPQSLLDRDDRQRDKHCSSDRHNDREETLAIASSVLAPNALNTNGTSPPLPGRSTTG